MISIVTAVFNTDADVLARTWASLKSQTNLNWEWVVYDDSPGLDAYRQIYGYCADERYKIRIYRPHVPSGGNIGKVKHDAFMLAYGDVIVELDHDDELTPDALALIDHVFTNNDIGFAYSDWCEILPNGDSGIYPQGWAFGYGSEYWDEEHQVWAMKAPPINTTTLSHIVSAPNHLRAWRASTYHSLNGHDISLEIADDYDLVVRTLLKYDYAYIPVMLYKQHVSSKTAQRQRNALIQEIVHKKSLEYKDQIIAKFGQGPYYGDTE